MHKRIFIVEDEAIVALEMKRAIKKLGYTVAGMAANYDDAIRGIDEHSPDLILVDITLKYSKSGIEIAKVVSAKYTIPIIFLTSITDEATMYDAIATNPVGYLLKPFRREELHSMILLGLYKAVHQTQSKTDMLSLGHGYYYHVDDKLLFYGEKHIALGKKEERLLRLLVEAKGGVVSFKTLEEMIWEGGLVSQSAFRTLLYRLNLKLEYKLIESLPAYGCRLLLPKT